MQPAAPAAVERAATPPASAKQDPQAAPAPAAGPSAAAEPDSAAKQSVTQRPNGEAIAQAPEGQRTKHSAANRVAPQPEAPPPKRQKRDQASQDAGANHEYWYTYAPATATLQSRRWHHFLRVAMPHSAAA